MNARADFEQQQAEQEREERALQALMKITAAGLKEEAETLAAECGLLSVWKSPIRRKREFEIRADGLPF